MAVIGLRAISREAGKRGAPIFCEGKREAADMFAAACPDTVSECKPQSRQRGPE